MFIKVIKKRFEAYKEKAEGAFDQLANIDIHQKQYKHDNSIYIQVKHMRGNMISRFTDILTTDGEKPWRHREEEFEEDKEATKEAMLQLWKEGWAVVFQTLDDLEDEDLKKEVLFRGEKVTLLETLLNSMEHYAYHIGQIVYIAKNIKREDWNYLTLPPAK